MVEVRIETPKFGFIKRKPDGSVDFISPFPCPFNYGSVEGTLAEDGDPLDAILLGPRVPAGSIKKAEQRGTVHFVDAGQEDPKLILSDHPLARRDLLTIRAFFVAYVLLKRAINRSRGRQGETKVVRFELTS